MIRKGDIVRCGSSERKLIGIVRGVDEKSTVGNLARVEFPNSGEFKNKPVSYTFFISIDSIEKVSDEVAMLWKLENV